MLFIFFIPYRLFEERKGEEEKRLKFKEDGQALKRDNVVRFCSFNLYFYFKFCKWCIIHFAHFLFSFLQMLHGSMISRFAQILQNFVFACTSSKELTNFGISVFLLSR